MEQKKRLKVKASKDDDEDLLVIVNPSEALPVIDFDEEDEGCLSGDALASFLYPIDVETFMARYWQQRALVIRGGESRLGPGVMSVLNVDDLEALMEESPSERIHVWLPRQGGVAGGAESIQVEPEAAMACYRSGVASLYFRAPQILIDSFVSSFGSRLGAAFGTFGADGSLCGEIETFVSRPNHVTDVTII